MIYFVLDVDPKIVIKIIENMKWFSFYGPVDQHNYIVDVLAW